MRSTATKAASEKSKTISDEARIAREALGPVTCDPGRALREVLELLDAANVHEQNDIDSDEEYSAASLARAKLFVIATEWKHLKERYNGTD